MSLSGQTLQTIKTYAHGFMKLLAELFQNPGLGAPLAKETNREARRYCDV